MKSSKKQNKEFEFVLSIGSNIICQRIFFVPDFNPKSLKSMNLYDMMVNIKQIIQNDLKIKDTNHINSHEYRDFENNIENNEYFRIDINMNQYNQFTDRTEKVCVNSRIFDSGCYHPYTRKNVDVRPFIKNIINDLSFVLSSKRLKTKYQKYELS